MTVAAPVTATDSAAVWRRRAAEVKAKLRTTAAERDRAGRKPVGEIGWLKDAELLGILIPQEYGGGGAAWADVAAVLQLIAEADSSIAHVL
ncbi:MAG TPA: acyl-CoA dehydrogenase family protein, partial [Mycobacterium sp.]|nr:acyl-CoA dehydrogenase family protein [Mycobacterium sp.]